MYSQITNTQVIGFLYFNASSIVPHAFVCFILCFWFGFLLFANELCFGLDEVPFRIIYVVWFMHVWTMIVIGTFLCVFHFVFWVWILVICKWIVFWFGDEIPFRTIYVVWYMHVWTMIIISTLLCVFHFVFWVWILATCKWVVFWLGDEVPFRTIYVVWFMCAWTMIVIGTLLCVFHFVF